MGKLVRLSLRPARVEQSRATVPYQGMAKPKQKGSMRPAGFTRWKRARTAYHLTAAEVAMAKATGFNPTVMEAAASNRSKPRRAGEKLPTRSKPGQNGGTIEKAQAIAAHESPKTTKLYDRTNDQITLDEVERILI